MWIVSPNMSYNFKSVVLFLKILVTVLSKDDKFIVNKLTIY